MDGTGGTSLAGSGAAGPERDRRPEDAVLRLDSTAGHLVRRAQQVHTALWTAEFDGDLTGPQYALLSALSRQPSLDQRSAGRRASLDKSTAADVVARLQRSG